ncbi:acyltransferase domain-containing protein [Haematomicrobium sanguinis]|uniref:acyltransferase domain-containing protein n=1 Tax=Haematomicrobium sanguinis TaxID=479106 RepID=UPI00068E4AA0|nr:acyltransferase domain-containing protein [Haematomicrobium sanguinis]
MPAGVAPDNGSWPIERLVEWAGILETDLRDVCDLLERMPPEALTEQLAHLHSIVGRPGYHAIDHDQDEMSWIAALIWFIPEQAQWYAEHGVSEEIGRASIADIGRHIGLSRRTLGVFGCETWWWLLQQASCSLFQLGRLQFQIQEHDHTLPVGADQQFDLGIHIPESGPMTPGAVDASLAKARPFFRRVYGADVDWGVCASWLLDPYLVQTLPESSNIVSFAERFTLWGTPQDSQDSALYFTFRTHDVRRVPTLPRERSIQRVVLERIEAGGIWQTASGYLPLP